MRRTEKARWTLTHVARDPRRPAGNYGIQGVRERLLVTLILRRGRSSALARRYKRRSVTFRTHLVCMKLRTCIHVGLRVREFNSGRS